MIVYIHEKEEVQYFIAKRFCLFHLLVAFRTMLIPTKPFFKQNHSKDSGIVRST